MFRPRRAGLHSRGSLGTRNRPRQLRDGLPAHGGSGPAFRATGPLPAASWWLVGGLPGHACRGPPYSACDPHGPRNVGGALSQRLSPVDGRRGESHRRSGPPAGQPVSRRTSPALRPVAASPPARQPGGRSGAGRHARRDPRGRVGGPGAARLWDSGLYLSSAPERSENFAEKSAAIRPGRVAPWWRLAAGVRSRPIRVGDSLMFPAPCYISLVMKSAKK